MPTQLVHGHDLRFHHNTVVLRIRRACLTCLPSYRQRGEKATPVVTITELVQGNFTRTEPNNFG